MSSAALLRACLTLAAAASLAQAQEAVGSIGGVVNDAAGAAVPNAHVTLINRETGSTRTTTTGDDGSFQFAAAPPGVYDIKVEVAGFATTMRKDVVVSVRQRVRLDITIEIGRPEQPTRKPARKTRAKPPSPAALSPGRITARDFLLEGAPEAPGYGLYSYILLGSRPRDNTSEQYRRYEQAIAAYLDIETAANVERYTEKAQINITYLPIRTAPAEPVTRDTALAAYDYARSQRILSLVSGRAVEGPYIVSARIPLTDARALPAEYLFQDLSTVPPNVVGLWVRQFKAQAAQERFWETQTKDQFVLSLRAYIARGGEQVSQIGTAVAALIWRFPGGSR